MFAKAILAILLFNFGAGGTNAQKLSADTIYPSKTVGAARCYVYGVYSNANILGYGVNSAKAPQADFFRNCYSGRNDTTKQNDIALVPVLNSVGYDSVRGDTKKEIYRSINFKLFFTVGDAFYIDMEDSNLEVIWEAQNPKGEWQPIE